MISQGDIRPVDSSQMFAYLARPEEQSGPHLAVTLLLELLRVAPCVKGATEVLRTIGSAGLAINYHPLTHPQLNVARTEEGYRQAMGVAAGVTRDALIRDVAAAA